MVTVKFYLVSNSVWLTTLRFIVDGMLGKLARWLRILGHDVHYYSDSEDKKLLEVAKYEKRVLLTRDHELYQMAKTQGAEAVLVDAPDVGGKLADLANRFGFKLEINLSISRCPKCNEMIRAVSKEMLVNQIPELTFTYYDEFWKCPGCGQVYWRGAHWKKIKKTLEEANSNLVVPQ
jgi:uncharacterized protein with PIN domain